MTDPYFGDAPDPAGVVIDLAAGRNVPLTTDQADVLLDAADGVVLAAVALLDRMIEAHVNRVRAER